jgi:hypothetical protein
MNWQDDPEIQQRRREHSVRMGVLRSALLWSPFFIASFGALLFFFFDLVTGGDRGTWFLLVVLAIFSVLFGSQCLQAWFDLFGEPTTMTAEVTRRWTRNDSIVMRTHYVRIGKTILRGDAVMLAEIKLGDTVNARFYKHSGVLVSIEKLPSPAVATPAVAPKF